MGSDLASHSLPFAITTHTGSVLAHSMASVGIASNVTNSTSVASFAAIGAAESWEATTLTILAESVRRTVVVCSTCSDGSLASSSVETGNAGTSSIGQTLTLSTAVAWAHSAHKHT